MVCLVLRPRLFPHLDLGQHLRHVAAGGRVRDHIQAIDARQARRRVTLPGEAAPRFEALLVAGNRLNLEQSLDVQVCTCMS